MSVSADNGLAGTRKKRTARAVLSTLVLLGGCTVGSLSGGDEQGEGILRFSETTSYPLTAAPAFLTTVWMRNDSGREIQIHELVEIDGDPGLEVRFMGSSRCELGCPGIVPWDDDAEAEWFPRLDSRFPFSVDPEIGLALTFGLRLLAGGEDILESLRCLGFRSVALRTDMGTLVARSGMGHDYVSSLSATQGECLLLTDGVAESSSAETEIGEPEDAEIPRVGRRAGEEEPPATPRTPAAIRPDR